MVAPIVFSFFSFATTAAIKCCQCFIFRRISHIVDAIAVQVSIVWHEKSADFCRPIILADFYRSCVMGLRLRKTDPCTKFEVSSVSHCKKFYIGCKILKRVSWPWPRPFQGRFFISRVGLAMVSQCTKFEVPRLTRYEAMNGGAKCRKWGGLGRLGSTQGHRQCHHSIECIWLPIRL